MHIPHTHKCLMVYVVLCGCSDVVSCHISHCQSDARKIKCKKKKRIEKRKTKQKTKFKIPNECTHRLNSNRNRMNECEMIRNSNILTGAKEISSQFAFIFFYFSASTSRCHPKMFVSARNVWFRFQSIYVYVSRLYSTYEYVHISVFFFSSISFGSFAYRAMI